MMLPSYCFIITIMNCCLLNAQSTRNKFTDITDLIEEHSCDITLITETWLKPDDPSSALTKNFLAGQNRSLVTCDRKGKKGGGIAIIYDPQKWRYKDIQTSTPCCAFEFICGRLHSETLPSVTILLLYRPPNKSKASFLTELETLLSELSSLVDDNLMVCGDANLHFDVPETAAIEMNQLLLHHQMSQKILSSIPTHKRGHSVDFVASTTPINSVAVKQLELSDHHPVFFKLALPQKSKANASVGKPTVYSYRNFKAVVIENFQSDLKVAISAVDSLSVDVLNSATLSVLDRHAPVELRKSSKKKSAHSNYCPIIAHEKRIRRKYERLVASHGLEIHRQLLLQQRIKIRKLSRSFTAKKFSEQIGNATSKSSALFKVVNNLTSEKKVETPSGDTGTVSEALAEFFHSKIDRIVSGFLPIGRVEYQRLIDSTSFTDFGPVDDTKVLTICPVKSSPNDILPTALYKEVFASMVPAYTSIVNESLSSGVVPFSLKQAVIKPSFKAGSNDVESPASYRPISMLPHLSKILEKCAAQQLIDHLDNHQLLHARQSAYRSRHSVETVMYHGCSSLIKELDKGRVAFLVLLDLSAAFDTIDHSLLLDCLERRFGVSGTALEWFKSYLADRTYQVQVGSSKSTSRQLCHGVPQGSILGPILFNCYMSDLLDRLDELADIDFHTYADDTQLWISFDPKDTDGERRARETLNQGLQLISGWMASHHLKLNQAKTIFMPLSRQNFQFEPLKFDNTTIAASTTCRNLGVILDSKMDMSKQISSVVRSCYFQLRKLRAIKDYLPTDYLTTLVHAFITSKLDFCNSILDGLPQKSLNRLQLVHNAAARFLTGSRKWDSATAILRKLHWLPIRKRIQFKILCFSHLVLAKKAPAYFADELVESVPPRATRQANRRQIDARYRPKLKTVGTRSMFYAMPHYFNRLPVSLANECRYTTFKRHTKTILFRETYGGDDDIPVLYLYGR